MGVRLSDGHFVRIPYEAVQSQRLSLSRTPVNKLIILFLNSVSTHNISVNSLRIYLVFSKFTLYAPSYFHESTIYSASLDS